MKTAVLLILLMIVLGAAGLAYGLAHESTALNIFIIIGSVVLLVIALLVGAAISESEAGRSFGPLAELNRLYATFNPQSAACGEGVHFTFHTYHGLLVWTAQMKHEFYLPAAPARELLWRLHCFNLKWGLFAYFGFVIPLLSYGNYLAQKRSIRLQERGYPPGH